MKLAQFDFVWIFAILAGGAILALAIWGALQTGDTLRFKGDTEAAKSISVLTDPMQAGFADASFGKIVFRQETRLNNICLTGDFGKNDISVATRDGVGKDWNLAGGRVSVHNKYIFSKERNEGFEFGVFSKSFEFPYEVSDLIFLMDGDYCFLEAPQNIIDEISGLGIENIFFDNCSSGDERVCFGGGEKCDSIVYGSCSGNCDSIFDEGVVSKGGGEMEYVGSLIYGAIFSDPAVYECNVFRLMYRTANIAKILEGKNNLMDARNCESNLRGDLIAWGSMLGNSSSEDLISLKNFADDLDNKNNGELCRLW
jgi:hypothetical protein